MNLVHLTGFLWKQSFPPIFLFVLPASRKQIAQFTNQADCAIFKWASFWVSGFKWLKKLKNGGLVLKKKILTTPGD